MKYKIVVDKQSRINPSNEKKEYEIDIEELRTRKNVCDSIVITREEAYVLRKLKLSDLMVLSELEKPIKEPLQDIKIELFEGDNYIYLVDMVGNKFYAEYLIKNEFNELFVTLNQMNSAINQSAKQIELTVNQKLEGYSTTEEMNALIQLLTNQINLELEKKIDGETITGAYLLLKINDDTSEAKLEADKVNLSGYVTIDNLKTAGKTIIDGGNIITGTIDASKATITNINADNIKSGTITGRNISGGTITGTQISNGNNFNVDKNGNMICSNGTFNGGKIDLIGKNNQALRYFADEQKDTSHMSYMQYNTIAVNNGNDMAELYCSQLGPTLHLTRIGDNTTTIRYNGITTPSLTQTSLASIKKNIEKTNVNALELIKNSDVYEYNLKTEENTDKKHIGFVIGDKYNTPKEVIANSGEGIDTYSMSSIMWKAIQELTAKVEQLEKEVANAKN